MFDVSQAFLSEHLLQVISKEGWKEGEKEGKIENLVMPIRLNKSIDSKIS